MRIGRPQPMHLFRERFMAVRIIDGREPARLLLADVARRAEAIFTLSGVQPSLATVLVGDDPASVTYTRMKRRRCEQVGIRPIRVELAADSTTEQVVKHVRKLGDDPDVHGILVQHPVPHPIDRRAVFEAIAVEKDVDGVTSAMLGRTLLQMPGYAACTPEGIMRLLLKYDIDIDGAHGVVIGRSPILGRPMASMLINAHATVTMCHSRTRNLPDITRHADILVAAVGRPRFIQGDWIKPGAVVIDAGYNPGNIGDVDFDAAVRVASAITPVPGGVGPMTIAVLLDHAVTAAAEQLSVEIQHGPVR